jgi:hypothetical protein
VLSYVVKMTSKNPAWKMVRVKTPEEVEEIYQPDFKGRMVVYAITAKLKEGYSKIHRFAVRLKIGGKMEQTKVNPEPRWSQTLKFDRH